MIACLTDSSGTLMERLQDVPVTLTNEGASRDSVYFPVDTEKSGAAYEVVSVRLCDFVTVCGTRMRALSFIDKAQHRAVLGYINK